MRRQNLKRLLFFCACISVFGCGEPSLDPPLQIAGDAKRGRQLLWQFGCGSCHQIKGVVGAIGQLGPPLDDFRHRVYIAGTLANTPENLVHWIQDPQSIDARTLMPDMGVSTQQARDIAAFLYGQH